MEPTTEPRPAIPAGHDSTQGTSQGATAPDLIAWVPPKTDDFDITPEVTSYSARR
jgi:hypothetical protein